jgi:hypothetical protein
MTLSTPQRCVREMTIMISGSVRDAGKPITIVALTGLPTVWLRVRGSHDVQSPRPLHCGSSTGRIPGCNRFSLALTKFFSNHYLTEESIPDC